MSTSTDAIIFYGYVWDEETSTPWTIGQDDEETTDEDWEERYARLKAGLEKPDTGNGFDQKVYSEYLAKKREIVKDCPCKVDTHCSGEYPMPYVCISDSYVCNSRGDMTELKPEQFEVEENWNDELKKFCKLMGITMPAGGPKWYLVSYWG